MPAATPAPPPARRTPGNHHPLLPSSGTRAAAGRADAGAERGVR
ncbi:hypothetical protein [Streptomyces sp. SJL17-1]|nr:hypothetical protein [Streptomyces sp. SJL17-1]